MKILDIIRGVGTLMCLGGGGESHETPPWLAPSAKNFEKDSGSLEMAISEFYKSLFEVL